eukprot:7988908-Ditylum_brightwellii.AAC.1
MRKAENLDAVWQELAVRDVEFDANLGWRGLLELLKVHKKSSNLHNADSTKYFKSVADYSNFKWNGV